MSKASNSSASRFFYSFGTVFLFAVLTICIINFTRDGRIFDNTAAAAVKTETASGSASTVEGTIKVDTSVPRTSAKSTPKHQTKPASQSKPPAGSTSSGARPANPGEEP